MVNKPASSVYSLVEKAYFRLQAGDVLTHCLEDGSTEPVHEMIQDMVLAGPQSMEALREVLGETIKRKAQVYDDMNQVTNQLSKILKDYGISMEKQGGNQVLQALSEQQLAEILDDAHIVDDETRLGSMEVVKGSRELIGTLNTKIQLLENIETYLQDWLWGLTYQHIKQGDDEAIGNSNKNELL